MFNDLSISQKGMILALLGFTSYALSDVCAKWLTQDIPIFQTILLTNASACGFFLLAAPWLGGIKSLGKVRSKRMHLIRGMLNVSISILILQSFARLPIADVYTFIFAMPFYAAVIAIFMYREHVTRHRWISIALGFAGVLIALQPGDAGINPDLIWPVACGIVVAFMFTVSKSLQGDSLLALGFWPVSFNVLVGSIVVLWIGFEAVPLPSLIVCLFNGLFIAVGVLCVSNAFRLAPASAVSPFLYTEMVWALLFGYFIFGDKPNAMMLMGAGVIIFSGLYLVETERRQRLKAARSG